MLTLLWKCRMGGFLVALFWQRAAKMAVLKWLVAKMALLTT